MCKHHKRLSDLAVLAQDVTPVRSARIISEIYIGNKKISTGICQYKTDPFQNRFKKNSESIYLHSEIHAIKNALKRVSVDDLKRATIYIARTKKKTHNHNEFEWGLAKPCSGCMKALRDVFELKDIIYTTDDNHFSSINTG